MNCNLLDIWLLCQGFLVCYGPNFGRFVTAGPQNLKEIGYEKETLNPNRLVLSRTLTEKLTIGFSKHSTRNNPRIDTMELLPSMIPKVCMLLSMSIRLPRMWKSTIPSDDLPRSIIQIWSRGIHLRK